MSQVINELCHVLLGLHGSLVRAVLHIRKNGWQLAENVNFGRGARTGPDVFDKRLDICDSYALVKRWSPGKRIPMSLTRRKQYWDSTGT